MIATRTVSDARVALDTIVARLNIEHFCKIFTDGSDETKRHIAWPFSSANQANQRESHRASGVM